MQDSAFETKDLSFESPQGNASQAIETSIEVSLRRLQRSQAYRYAIVMQGAVPLTDRNASARHDAVELG